MKTGLLFILIVITINGFAQQDTVDFTGYVDNVIEKQNSNERNDVFLKLQSSKDSSIYYIDDFYLVYFLERTHQLTLSDFTKKELPEKIGLGLKNITTEKKSVSGRKGQFIVSMDSFNPNNPKSEYYYNYSDYFKGKPKPDFYHRYIEVPVSYDYPEMGKFKLYYELCSDYDETKPTILIATDGQNTFSQVGMADKYKEMFGLDYNTATYEYRGMFASRIPQIDNKTQDWDKVYKILNVNNVVEDIERIRQDLKGDEKIYILGGSGTSMTGLKYISKYPDKVKKAFLMSFFQDAKASSEAGVYFLDEFLSKNKLKDTYAEVINNPKLDQEQVLFVIQRLFYYDKEKVKELLQQLSENDTKLLQQYTAMVGKVDHYIRLTQKYRPWAVTFMYETNIKTNLDGMPDINQPFYKIGTPVREARKNKHSANDDLFSIDNMDQINTKILLVAGTLDQVAPIREMKKIHSQLPNSTLAVFEAYHCLQASDKSKDCRSQLANLFFKKNTTDTDIHNFLKSEDLPCRFVEYLTD